VSEIGNDVSVGHNAIIHGAKIGNNVLIGMGAIIMDNAVVPDNTIIAAGAVVLSNAVLEPGVYAGIPAKKVKDSSEAVYEAATAGKVEYKIKEGTHIKTGTKLADFKSDGNEGSEVMAARSKYADIIENVGSAAVKTSKFISKSSGIVSYYADGYESILTPKTMGKYTMESIQEITPELVELKQSPVRPGEPVLKICDNDNWYIMCWVESASIANYEIGNNVTVSLPAGSVDMTIENIVQDGDYWKITMWSNNYYEEFSQSRIEEGLLLSKDYAGLKTETSNIILDGKDPVVLVLRQDGDYNIVKVKVLANDGTYSVLEDFEYTDADGNYVRTVDIYDEILRNPSEGDLQNVKDALKKGEEDAE
jgi:putative membrane fusion protein